MVKVVCAEPRGGMELAEALRVAIWDHRSPAEVRAMLAPNAVVLANDPEGNLTESTPEYMDTCLGYGPLIRNVRATAVPGMVRAQADVALVGPAIFFVWYEPDVDDPAKIGRIAIESYPTKVA